MVFIFLNRDSELNNFLSFFFFSPDLNNWFQSVSVSHLRKNGGANAVRW